MPGRLLGILCTALLLASGCSKTDQDRREILQTLTIRAAALNTRDMTQYLSVVSPKYNDKGKDLIRLKESLEKNFRDFGRISYEPGTPAITITGTSAKSVSGYRMKIEVLGKTLDLNGTEHLRLAKEPEGWKIIAGI